VIQILRGNPRRRRWKLAKTGNRSVLAHLRTALAQLPTEPAGGRRGPEKLIDGKRDVRRQARSAEVMPLTQGSRRRCIEWLEHAWTTFHDAGATELLVQSFPARL